MSVIPALVLAFTLLAMVTYIQFRFTAYMRSDDLVRRLRAYAEMKVASDKEESKRKSDLLTSMEHEVLLGTLKKVEAKNAALFQAFTFIAAGNLALISSESYAQIREYLVSILVLSLPFFWASLQGMKQVDQLDMPTTSDSEALAKEMQDALKRDLLVKEASYDFAYKGAFLFVTLAVLAFAIYMFAKKNG